MCYSTKLAVNFAKLLSFLKKRGTNCYVKIDNQNSHETGLFALSFNYRKNPRTASKIKMRYIFFSLYYHG